MTFVEQKIIHQIRNLSEAAKQRLLNYLMMLLEAEKPFQPKQWHKQLLDFPTWPDYTPPKMTSWEIDEW